jgi:hypothetical protein
MGTITTIPEASFSRLAPWFSIDGNQDMVLWSDDQIPTIVERRSNTDDILDDATYWAAVHLRDEFQAEPAAGKPG